MKALLLMLVVGLIAFTRVAAAQSIAGEWNSVMNTPIGARSSKIVFKQDGETLTGTVKREAGDASLQGTVKGTAVQFSYTIDYNGSALVISITATVSGNSMQGTVSFGGQAEDEWSAKRAAASATGAATVRQNSQPMPSDGRMPR